MTAQQVEERRTVELPDGLSFPALPGDWVISSGSQVIDVVPKLGEKFEAIEEGLVLPREICVKIEKTTGIGTTQTADKLTAAIDRLARIAIGSIRVEFTPGQLEEIKHRATKRGSTVKQELERVIERIKDELFYGSMTPRS